MSEFEKDIKEIMAKHEVTSIMASCIIRNNDNVVIAMINDDIDLVCTGLSLLIASTPDIFTIMQQVILNIFVEKFTEMRQKHATKESSGILDKFDIEGVKPS